MKYIQKKILPEFFKPLFEGYKNFEIRKDEDDVQLGDIFFLCEWDPAKKDYTGSLVTKRVKYVFRADDYEQDFGLKPGYCVIGFF